MRLSLDAGPAGHVIRAYAPGQITVDDEVITASVVVTPQRIVRDWPPQRFEDLSATIVAALTEHEPQIVLLGTGAGIRFPTPDLLAGLYDRGIGVEIMDTAAACRTFNILSAEGRRVVAALLMI